MRHEDIVAKVDILRLIERLGLEGKILGKEFITNCPFPEHDDKTPSFSIAISGDSIGKWRCFGCGAAGNSLHLVQRVLGVEREQAEKQIAQWFGFPDSLNYPSTEEISKLLDKRAPKDEEEDIIRIPLPKMNDSKNEIISYLMSVRSYTEKQALDIINFFNIKWVNSGYYSDRLIIPVYDSFGSLITFEARSMGKVEPKTLYPRGSPIGHMLFNNHNLSGGQVWITEGIWDAIRLWTFGEPAVSVFGSHVGPYQARALISKYSDAFLLFDGDDAGRKAKDEASGLLRPYMNVYEVDLWFGDPSDLTKEDFRELVRQLNIKR